MGAPTAIPPAAHLGADPSPSRRARAAVIVACVAAIAATAIVAGDVLRVAAAATIGVLLALALHAGRTLVP
jgi:hypothetical protein